MRTVNVGLIGLGTVGSGVVEILDRHAEHFRTRAGVDLALVKQARDPAGTLLPDMAPVSSGQTLYFLLLIDNPTAAPASDLRVLDLLDESRFTYLSGTLEQALLPSGSDDAAIWAGSFSPLSDAVGAPDDGGSATDTGGATGADRITFGAVPSQANATIEVPAATMWVVRFQVRVN